MGHISMVPFTMRLALTVWLPCGNNNTSRFDGYFVITFVQFKDNHMCAAIV